MVRIDEGAERERESEREKEREREREREKERERATIRNAISPSSSSPAALVAKSVLEAVVLEGARSVLEGARR